MGRSKLVVPEPFRAVCFFTECYGVYKAYFLLTSIGVNLINRIVLILLTCVFVVLYFVGTTQDIKQPVSVPEPHILFR